MPTCPYCATATVEDSRVCKNCGRALVMRCLYCAEDIPVLAKICRFCNSPVSPTVPAPMTPPPPPGPIPTGGPVGSERSLIGVFLLSFLTCGLWRLFVQHEIGQELNAHRRRDALSPGIDVLLTILTCGLWCIYVDFSYAQAVREISTEEGGHPQDVTTICLVLQIGSLFVPGLGLVSLLVLQDAMNNHWKRHTTG